MMQTSLFDDWKPVHRDPVVKDLSVKEWINIPRHDAEIITANIGKLPSPDIYWPRCLPIHGFHNIGPDSGEEKRYPGARFRYWGHHDGGQISKYIGDGVIYDVLSIHKWGSHPSKTDYVNIVKTYVDEDVFRIEDTDGNLYSMRYETEEDIRPSDIRERKDKAYNPEHDTEHLIIAMLRGGIPCAEIESLNLSAYCPQIANPPFYNHNNHFDANPNYDKMCVLAEKVGVHIPFPYIVPVLHPDVNVAPIHHCRYCLKRRSCNDAQRKSIGGMGCFDHYDGTGWIWNRQPIEKKHLCSAGKRKRKAAEDEDMEAVA